MNNHEHIGTALFREREERLANYNTRVAERASMPETTPPGLLRIADNRVACALEAIKNWRDPVPSTASVTPEEQRSLSRPAGVTDTADAIASRILASDDNVAPIGMSEADIVARRIAESDVDGLDQDPVEAMARRIAAA